ncbi:hypothetical protein NC651_034064 [Populus alba x Populus x berolinensis]|nr:hypothetical protein NC651_034064 [Populus alba x Populus x berolinensis]
MGSSKNLFNLSFCLSPKIMGGFEPVPKLSIYRFLFMDLRCSKAP